jgi:hypothetical protein
MDWRIAPKLVLPVVIAFALAVGPAALAGDQAPNVAVKFKRGTDTTFAGTRFDGEYVASSKRVYFLGFRTTANATDGSVWYYDTAAKTYTDTGVDLVTPVSNYGIAALNDANGLGLYIFGGRDANGVIVDSTQVYYPATNTAAVVATDPFPGETPAGCVSLPANGVQAVGNKGVVMGGASFAANGCVDDNSAQTWVFDPMAAAGARWTQGPNLNMARGYVTPGLLGQTIYAIGGDTNAGGVLTAQSIVESWKIGDASWNDAGVADLPQACDESQAFGYTKGKLKNTVTLAGCGQWPNAVKDVLQYSSTGNAWSNVGTLNDNRRNHAGALVGKGKKAKMYVFGGYGEPGFGEPIKTIEIGKAGSGSSASAPSAPAAGATTASTS